MHEHVWPVEFLLTFCIIPCEIDGILAWQDGSVRYCRILCILGRCLFCYIKASSHATDAIADRLSTGIVNRTKNQPSQIVLRALG